MEFVEQEKYKNEIGIYKIENRVNNSVYVGQTSKGFQRRFWFHQWKLRQGIHDNTYLQHSWDKYGEDNFYFSVIEITDTNSLNEREKFWISHYRTVGNCFNMQDGGQPSCLCKFKSSESYKLVGAKNRQRMLGTKLPDSTKQKMSEARKGKYYYKSTDTITPDTARKIKEMYLSGHTSRDIGATLNVPYRVLNNILSANGWSTVKVDGWEEFCNTRNKHKGVAVNGKKQCARTK